MTRLAARDNDEWVRDLSGSDDQLAAALSDLRAQLLARVRRAWAGNNCVNDELLEDAVQNSLVQIHSNLAKYQGRARFLTWATTIAVHAVITEMRRRRWSEIPLQSANQSIVFSHEKVDSALSPQVQLAQREVLDMLNTLIQQELTDRQRTVLLAELQGMPLAEIAARLESNRNAVYKLAHDARRRLKSQLESYGYGASEIAELWTSSREAK